MLHSCRLNVCGHLKLAKQMLPRYYDDQEMGGHAAACRTKCGVVLRTAHFISGIALVWLQDCIVGFMYCQQHSSCNSFPTKEMTSSPCANRNDKSSKTRPIPRPQDPIDRSADHLGYVTWCVALQGIDSGCWCCTVQLLAREVTLDLPGLVTKHDNCYRPTVAVKTT